MNFPKITELVTYINKALTGADWNSNWQKLINWLTLGNTDIKVKNIETESITNNGTLTQSGTIDAEIINADIVNANSFVGDGSNLENVKVADIFSYTPFSVNSAKANFVGNDTTKLTFDIDDTSPLLVTTAKGKQIKITSINDYDVSGLTSATYYVFVDEQSNGGSAYLKACDIYRQTETPSGNNGDVWLDTSTEPFVCREKVSSNWYTDEYDKVPVAKVVISGGEVSSLTMLPFNVNGVNVVYDGKFTDLNDLKRPVVIVRYWQSTESDRKWFQLFSNGWCEQGGTGSANEGTITFAVAFADTNYTLVASLNNTEQDEAVAVFSRTTTSFSLHSENTPSCDWRASGFVG